MSENALIIVENTELSTVRQADQNPALVYLAGLRSANSKRAMLHALETIADILSSGRQDARSLNWGALRFSHTAAIRAELSNRFKYTTANNMLSALRGVLKAAYRLGQISPDDYARASDIGVVRGQSIPKGRDLASGELIALVNACKADKTPAGHRDAAIIGVLYTCGLRRAELAALDLANYDAESGRLTVRHGKGGKDRTVYVTNGAKTALDRWIITRGTHDGALFGPINKGGRMIACRMTTQAVYNILKKRAEQAGVKDFSPHDMRRTFVSDMLDRGADIATVAKLAGHASVTTTARYDRRTEETKRKAAALLHFPF
jgi:integrase